MRPSTPSQDFGAGACSLPREGTAAPTTPPPPSAPRLLCADCNRGAREGDGAELLERARRTILADASHLPPLEELGAQVVIVYLDAGELRILVSSRATAARVFLDAGARCALEALDAVDVPPGEIAIVALVLGGEKRDAVAGSAPWPTTRTA